MTAQKKPKFRCENQKCVKGCPILKADPKVEGCDYGGDIMQQIVAGMKSGSRPFEDVCKELGLE